MAGVRLHKLQKTFGAVVAVDEIDLEIFDQELIVLVGPSGCGKTTTLRLIAGLEEATAGEIWIGDRQVNRVAPKDRDIAMVFQRYALYPHMNVYKNMAFGLKMRRVPKAEIAERIQDTARILGIEDLLERKPAQLSGGQQQRVALGRAMVRQPAVFLFDEPLSNLDAKLRVSMRTELVRLHQRLRTTMVHVTHDQVEAMMMGDRIVVMNGGRIQQLGKPVDVYTRPANRFVAEFIGSPPMNFLRGTLDPSLLHDSKPLRFQGETASITLPDAMRGTLMDRVGNGSGKCELGVRPEHLTLLPPRESGAEDGEAGEAGLSAEVSVIQALGAETLIEVTHGELRWLARATANPPWQVGDRVHVALDAEHVHWFDAASGERLSK